MGQGLLVTAVGMAAFLVARDAGPELDAQRTATFVARLRNGPGASAGARADAAGARN